MGEYSVPRRHRSLKGGPVSSLSMCNTARNFSDVVNKVFYRGESMDLTRGGKVVARLVPAGAIETPTGREVLAGWKTLLHLSGEEAEAFASEIEKGRQSLNQIPTNKWD